MSSSSSSSSSSSFASAGNATEDPASTSSTTALSHDEWLVILGLALLVGSYLFRVELVRFTLKLLQRMLPPHLDVWFKEFEKTLQLPLSWVVFVLFMWLSMVVMDMSSLLGMDSATLASIVSLIIGIPLIWVVIAFCNYVTWGIIRVKGWNRAASKDDDDYSRMMIVTEGIGVIKILLVAAVISSFMIDGIGSITDFDSSEITTVAVFMVQLVFLFGAHSWLKNVMGGLMALTDEQIKSGSHVRFQGHEGVVERLFLQCFSLRQYDKGLAYIPNAALLENTLEIQTKTLDRRCVIPIHFDHKTKSSQIRLFIQKLDTFLSRLPVQLNPVRKAGEATLGVTRPRGGAGGLGTVAGSIANLHEQMKLLKKEEEKKADKGQFWISVEAPYVIHVVYYSHKRHMIPLMAEKTEIVLCVTELLAEEKLKLHNEARERNDHDQPTPRLHTRESPALSLERQNTRNRALYGLARNGPRSEPNFAFQRQSTGTFRRRRLNVAEV